MSDILMVYFMPHFLLSKTSLNQLLATVSSHLHPELYNLFRLGTIKLTPAWPMSKKTLKLLSCINEIDASRSG